MHIVCRSNTVQFTLARVVDACRMHFEPGPFLHSDIMQGCSPWLINCMSMMPDYSGEDTCNSTYKLNAMCQIDPSFHASQAWGLA